MGWTGIQATHYKPDGKIDVISECRDAVDGTNSSGTTWEMLKASKKGNTVYMAVKYTEKGKEPIVYGEVMLIHINMNDSFNFTYKPISEEMGPCESECPESILKMLSPTDNEYALAWRKRCQDYAEVKRKKERLCDLPVGSIIETKNLAGEGTVKLVKIKVPSRKQAIWYDGVQYRYRTVDIESNGFKIIKK